ncbi:MAG: hypothetical protein EBY65_03630 [Acidimicrobiia bacterium]|nr:hypothetical protein [Acidimicrobiia bacterium]
MAPQLSLTLVTFSAADPGGWEHLAERARLADHAGIDRLALSDHVAFGPDLDAYDLELRRRWGGAPPC